MGKETTSRTEKEADLGERLFGGGHYKTTISGDGKTDEGRGRTSKESQKVASGKHDKKK